MDLATFVRQVVTTVSHPLAPVAPQSPAWLVYDVPVVSSLFAFIAALFAVLSWLRMASQIDLAKRQIAQQDKAIDLAIKDFDATLAALSITKRQADLADEERARSPILSLQATRK